MNNFIPQEKTGSQKQVFVKYKNHVINNDVIRALILYGTLGLIVICLILTRELDFDKSIEQRHFIGIEGLNWNLEMNDLAMWAVTVSISLLIIACLLLRKVLLEYPAITQKLISATLVFFVLTSGLLYLYTARGVAQRTFVKAHDSYHYFLGPKYFDELGYLGLYEATVTADAESDNPIFREKDYIRNLKDHSMISIEEANILGKAWKANFSQERWQAFKSDIEFYKDISGTYFRNIVRDRGYNGTPFHTFVAGHLANIWDLNYRNATLFCLYDIIGLLVMMVFISWGFGWKAGALFAIFFFTSFTDRHYYIGGSFLRYYWMIPSGIGIALLKKRFHFLSAFFISTAAMFNVFPILLLLGIGAKTIYRTVLEKSIPLTYRKFIWGIVAASAIWGILSISHTEGIQNYSNFFSNMETQTELATRSRIGFRYLFILPNEFNEAIAHYGYSQKAEDLGQLKPIYQSTGIFLLFLALYLSRKRSDTEAVILAGMSAFLLIFNTVEYYYGMIGMLPLIWLRGSRKRFLIMYVSLMAGMSLIYWVYFQTESLMIAHNYLVTLLLLLFLFTSYILIIFEQEITSKAVKTKTSSFFAFSLMKNKLVNFYRSIKVKHGKPLIVISSLVLLLVAISVFYQFNKSQSAVPGSDDQKPQGVLVFGGDVNLGRRQHLVTTLQGVDDALGQISLLAEADLSVANLECVVAHGGVLGVDKEEQGPYYFRARPEMLAILEKAGIDVVITANNHSGDYGPEALLEQMSHLDSMNLGHAGAGANLEEAIAPVFRMVGEVSVAIFGIDTTQRSFAASKHQPGTFYLNLMQYETARLFLEPRIEAAREKADVVLIAVHWGPNFVNTPGENKIRFGHALIDAGADAVLGSSAHVLQGIEVYKNRPIIHDAGNLLFDLTTVLDSGLFALTLEPEGVKAVHFHPLESHHGFTRVPSNERANEITTEFVKLSSDLGTEFKINSDGTATLKLDDLPDRARAVRYFDAPEPDVGKAPLPLTDPPDNYTISYEQIPESAIVDPVRFGPLELIGIEAKPEIITKREMLYLTSYWRLAEGVNEAPPGLMLQLRAEPDYDGPTWSGAHEPCDWGWPANRFEPGVIYRDHYGLRPPAIDGIKDGTLNITASVLTPEWDLIDKRVTVGEVQVQLD